MKMAITGDIHLNNNTYQVVDPDTGLYIKTVDAIAAFRWFVNESVHRRIDRVVIIGDVYHHYVATEPVRRHLSLCLQELAQNGIQVVILTGNHDFCSQYHALESLAGWNKLIKILDQPFVEMGVATYMPHTIEVECERTDFRTLIQGMPSSCSGRHVFFGHFGVRGAMRDNLSREESGGAVSTVDIEGTGATVAFLGHFHKYQRIKSKIPVFYTGSIENHRMDDMDGKRGFFIYDTDSGEYERIDYQGFRPMHSIEVDCLDAAMVLFEDGDWDRSIVRLDAVGEHVDFLKIHHGMKEVKHAFCSRGGTYVFCRDRTGAKKDRSAKVEIESIEQIDIMATLRAGIDERLQDDPRECTATKALLDEIHAEEVGK